MSPNIADSSLGTVIATFLIFSTPSLATGGGKTYLNPRRLDSYMSALEIGDRSQNIQLQSSNIPNFSVVGFDLISAMGSLNSLRNLPDDWDGYGSLKPNQRAISKASKLLEEIYLRLDFARLPWNAPHISATENGDVLIEWWNKNHKLSLYVGPRKSDFIKVWGPNIESEMEEGRLLTSNVIPLWNWLRS